MALTTIWIIVMIMGVIAGVIFFIHYRNGRMKSDLAGLIISGLVVVLEALELILGAK